MGYKYNGDVIVTGSLTVNTPKPLDSRTVVDNLSELYKVPKDTAYLGMTVANIDNGNIYMLKDIDQITNVDGWQASYENIQIKTCSQDEYDKLKENTDENGHPYKNDLPYLHSDTYYYIYEDEENDDYYLHADWGKDISDRLDKKASSERVEQLESKYETLNRTIKNFVTSTEVVNTYATKALVAEYFNTADENSVISGILKDYYLKNDADTIFVSKTDLNGGEEGSFNFVNQSQYETDQNSIWSELNNTLKVGNDGNLNSITVSQIKSPKQEETNNQLTLDITPEGLFVGEDSIAFTSGIPKIMLLTEDLYDKYKQENQIKEDTYYYIYSEDNNDPKNMYVTLEYVQTYYVQKSQVSQLEQQIFELSEKVKLLEDLVKDLESKAFLIQNNES